jgi:hypothetical protein
MVVCAPTITAGQSPDRGGSLNLIAKDCPDAGSVIASGSCPLPHYLYHTSFAILLALGLALTAVSRRLNSTLLYALSVVIITVIFVEIGIVIRSMH